MADIRTSFAGLELCSPILVGSSGLSRSLDKVKAFEAAGAGAVILKSLFEEQIEALSSSLEAHNDYTEGAEYLSHYVRADEVRQYLEQIRYYKSELSIPTIASICCKRSTSWVDFASQIQEAQADALEVNIMQLETDLFFNPTVGEQGYVQLIQQLKDSLRIPLIVKLSRYHTALPALIDKLRAAGADAVTLFNRTYQIDIDLESEELKSGDVFSHEGDFTESLRFTALVSGAVKGIDVSTSTGVYSWREVVKAILAGASTVQMTTMLYKEGPKAISEALSGLKEWMEAHGYESLDEICGRLNSRATGLGEMYERIQFMRYFGGQK